MKEPDNVQQALLVEDCISYYLRLLLSTEDTFFLPRLWRFHKTHQICHVPLHVYDVLLVNPDYWCSSSTCEWECMWVDIDLIGPQRWPTALTTCCSNGQWGTCVCMWKNNCGVESSSLSRFMFSLCSQSLNLTVITLSKLTVRTWALDYLFMCCESTALLTLQKQKLHLKMHLQTFNAADRQNICFILLHNVTILSPSSSYKLI